jgi:hypothetical protein
VELQAAKNDGVKLFSDDKEALRLANERARAATGPDPRTLLGIQSRDQVKSLGASIAAQFREGAAVEALRAKSATGVDARTLLGLQSRDEAKSIGASIAAQFREGVATESLRAKSATGVDVRTLLGLQSRDEAKSIGASIAAQFREGAAAEALRAKAASKLDVGTLLGIDISGKSARASAEVFTSAYSVQMQKLASTAQAQINAAGLSGPVSSLQKGKNFGTLIDPAAIREEAEATRAAAQVKAQALQATRQRTDEQRAA